MRSRFADISINVTLVFLAVATILPTLWMGAASVMEPGEASTLPLHLVPRTFTWENYAALLERLDMWVYFFNSLIIAFVVTCVSLVLNSMAGFAFAKYRFPGREKFFRILLTGLVVPAQVTMLPLFLMLKSMGVVNTYLGAMIPGLTSIFGIFLMRQFIKSVPDSLIEAARMDGATEWRVYRTVILPLCRPILFTLALFTFMGTWNDFMWPLIIMTDNSMYTLPVALAGLMGEHVQDLELMMAGSVVTTLPVVVLFLAFQKQYIHGIMMGGVKE